MAHFWPFLRLPNFPAGQPGHFDRFGLFLPFLGHFYGNFPVRWKCFKKLTAKFSKTIQEMAEIWFCQRKICKIVQKRALFRILLKKKGHNRRFNLRKCAVRECAWKHPGWILNVLCIFVKVHMTFERFFWPRSTHLTPFWPIFAPYLGHTEPLSDHFGTDRLGQASSFQQRTNYGLGNLGFRQIAPRNAANIWGRCNLIRI